MPRPYVKALYVIPNPLNMQWEDWRDNLVGFNRELANTSDRDADWRVFAERMTLSVPRTPDHAYFESWQAWANALRNAISF